MLVIRPLEEVELKNEKKLKICSQPQLTNILRAFSHVCIQHP